MLIATLFDFDGQRVEGGEFCLLTRSFYRALIDVQQVTAFEPILFSQHFIVFAKDKARLVVGVM